MLLPAPEQEGGPQLRTSAGPGRMQSLEVTSCLRFGLKLFFMLYAAVFFKKRKKNETKQKKTPLLGTRIESTKHLERDFASLRVKGNYC